MRPWALTFIAALLAVPALAAPAAGPADGVDAFYGSYQTAFEMALPPHYGTSPQISLSYNSAAGVGFTGLGWSLSGFPTIERASPGGGAPRYDGNDVYLYEGQPLVPCAAGSVSPSCTSGGTHSTRIESYQRFTLSGNTWTITAKDGSSFTLQPILWMNTTVFRFGVSTAQDISGNQVQYGWSCDGNECYPGSISYNSVLASFIYEQRPDVYTYANGRGLITVSRRLKTVSVTVSGRMLRAYQLTYGAGSTQRSRLSTIRTYGTDASVDAAGNCTGSSVLGLSVGWTNAADGWVAEQGFDTGASGDFIFNRFSDQRGYGTFDGDNWPTFQFADVDGDGRQDACIRMDYGLHCYLANGHGFSYSAGFETRIFTNAGANSEDNWSTLHFADVTGDGKADACFRRDQGLQCCPSNGTTFDCTNYPGFTTSYFANATGFDADNWKTLQFADVNGDGKADACLRRDSGMQCLLSTGTGFVYSAAYDTTLLANASGFDEDNWATIQFPDIDGDGKADLAVRLDTGIRFWLSTGNGFVDPPATSSPIFQNNMDQRGQGAFDADNWRNIVFVDVNGDGKADVCGRMDFGVQCYLSTGSSFVYSAAWDSGAFGNNVNTHGIGAFDSDNVYSFRMADVNGDGRPDACIRLDSGLTCVINTGNGFVAMSQYDSFATGQAIFKMGTDQRGYGTFDADNTGSLQFVDVKGDGKADPCIRMDYGVHCVTGAAQPELVTSITNSAGGTTTIEYAPSSAWPNTNNPPLVETVSAINNYPGRGPSSRTTFRYASGLYDAQERRFLGFGYVQRTLPQLGNEATAPYDETWYRQDYGSVSKPSREDFTDGQQHLISSETHTYAVNGSTLPYTSVETETWHTEYDGTGIGCASWPCAHGRRVVTTRNWDNDGNPFEEINYGDYDVAGDERTVRIIFEPNRSAYILGRPALTDTFNGVGESGAMLARSVIYYDNAPDWTIPPAFGRPTTSLLWYDQTGGYVGSNSAYDARGNLISQTNAVGARTSFTIDAQYGRFVVATTTPNGATATATWDPVCGVKTQVVDGAGNAANMQYDAFCRLVREDLPGGRFTIHRYNDSGSPTAQYREIESNSLDGATPSIGREYYDGLNRVWRREGTGPSGLWIWKDTDFDARGNTARQSAAYYSNALPNWTSFAYDAMGRTTSIVNPDGTASTTSYDHQSSLSTNELGQQVLQIFDAAGHCVERRESGGPSGWAITRYSFDVRGNLSGMTDAAGNTWTYGYDSFNHRLFSNDPDHGYWTYGYDGAGRQVSQVDADGQTTNIEYDTSDRVIARTTRAGLAGQLRTTWAFDEARPGYSNFGHITTMVDQWGTTTYDYDVAGNTVRTIRSQDGATYTVQSGYSTAGQLLWTQYPDGDSIGNAGVPYRYDAAGRNVSIPGFVNAATYDAEGHILQQQNANGTVSNWSYSTRNWLNTLRTTSPSATLQDLTYTRNAIGRTTQVMSSLPNESWSYGYDGRNQLLSVTAMTAAGPVSSPYNQSFSYDVIGNMTYNSRVGTYTYPAAGSARPHAQLTAGPYAYSYDANGNTLSGANRTFDWSGDNQPVRVNGITYAYDGLGRRVRSLNNGVPTVFVADDYEQTSGVATKYVSFAGRLAAKRVGAVSYWIHADDKNSVQSITDASGAQVQRFDYYGYGERLQTATGHPETRSFTGQRQDETGLIYLHARYYDPVVGRFISPDPTLPTDGSIGLNRYAYASNDPVNLVDIDGLGSFWHELGRVLHQTGHFFAGMSRMPVVGGLFQLPVMIGYAVSGHFDMAARMFAVSVVQDFAAVLTVATGGGATPVAAWLVVSENFAIGAGSAAMTAVIEGKHGRGIYQAALWGGTASAGSAALAYVIPDQNFGSEDGGKVIAGTSGRASEEQLPNGSFHIEITGMTTNDGYQAGHPIQGLLQDIKDISSDRIGKLDRTERGVMKFLSDNGAAPGATSVTGHSLGAWDALGLARNGAVGHVLTFGTPGLAANVTFNNIPGVHMRIITGMFDPVSISYYTPAAIIVQWSTGGRWGGPSTWCHVSNCYGMTVADMPPN
ncbi:MAG TPA: RHS repeat-associated core domain-containing protein [Myxococcales bacterium]